MSKTLSSPGVVRRLSSVVRRVSSVSTILVPEIMKLSNPYLVQMIIMFQAFWQNFEYGKMQKFKSSSPKLLLDIAHKYSLGMSTFITSRLYLRTFCDIRLDTEHIKVTEGHQMNLVLTVLMHNYS